MLKDYVENRPQRQDTTYTIYAYFGNDSGNTDFLAEDSFYGECSQSLVEDKKNSITTIDAAIQNEFKNKLNLEVGESFEDKEKSVQRKLKEALGGEEKETSLYFYPNAMNLIFSLSIEKDEKDRSISKKDFLESINNKKILFGIWQKLEQGKDALLSKIKKQLNQGDFHHNKRRLVFIETNFLGKDKTGYGDNNLLLDFVISHGLVDKNKSAIPLTVVVKTSEAELKSLKSNLIDNGKEFNDGHEFINFNTDVFNKMPIINTKKPLHQKIERSSYEIKILQLSSYLSKIAHIDKPQTAIYFSKEAPFNLEGVVQYHVPTVETYRDINEILN
jgi:hypothetical protein